MFREFGLKPYLGTAVSATPTRITMEEAREICCPWTQNREKIIVAMSFLALRERTLPEQLKGLNDGCTALEDAPLPSIVDHTRGGADACLCRELLQVTIQDPECRFQVKGLEKYIVLFQVRPPAFLFQRCCSSPPGKGALSCEGHD